DCVWQPQEVVLRLEVPRRFPRDCVWQPQEVVLRLESLRLATSRETASSNLKRTQSLAKRRGTSSLKITAYSSEIFFEDHHNNSGRESLILKILNSCLEKRSNPVFCRLVIYRESITAWCT
ncbi:hypothetical protein L9F63_012979, partial [Diploptera punctata]